MISHSFIFHHCRAVSQIRVSNSSSIFLYLHLHPAEFITPSPLLPTTLSYYTLLKIFLKSICITDRFWGLTEQRLCIIHQSKVVEEKNGYLKKNQWMILFPELQILVASCLLVPYSPPTPIGIIFFLRHYFFSEV